MPTLRNNNVAAGTANAFEALKNRRVGEAGAWLTIFGSAAVAGGTITASAEDGNKLLADEIPVNVESAADFIDGAPGNIVCINEFVGEGEIFAQVLTQVCNVMAITSNQPLVFGA